MPTEPPSVRVIAVFPVPPPVFCVMVITAPTTDAENLVPAGPLLVLMTFIKLVAVTSLLVAEFQVPATELWSPFTKS